MAPKRFGLRVPVRRPGRSVEFRVEQVEVVVGRLALAEAENPNAGHSERRGPGHANRDRVPSLAHTFRENRDAEQECAQKDEDIVALESPGLPRGIVGVINAVVREAHRSMSENEPINEVDRNRETGEEPGLPRQLAAVGGFVPVQEGVCARPDQEHDGKNRETAKRNHDGRENGDDENEWKGFGVHGVALVAHRRGDVDGDVASREKRLDDQRCDGGDECAHDRPLGRFRLSFLDIPGRRDNHGEGSEVGDAGKDSHTAADGGIEGGLSEDEAAALKQKRGGEKVRIHGHDCTTTR